MTVITTTRATRFCRNFAEILRGNFRASDITARMGGDEFLLVLRHVDEKHIRMAVGRLREQIAPQKFSFGAETITVTASFGAPGFQGQEPREFSKLVRQADKALYCAKRTGRKQITIELP